MTRKDYVLIANALKASKPEPHWDANRLFSISAQWIVSINRVADALSANNNGFKRQTFLDACGEDD